MMFQSGWRLKAVFLCFFFQIFFVSSFCLNGCVNNMLRWCALLNRMSDDINEKRVYESSISSMEFKRNIDV